MQSAILPPSSPAMALPTAEHHYWSEPFHEIWQRHFQPKFKLRDSGTPTLTLFPRCILKGLVQIRELRTAGWNTAIFHDFDKARLTDFKTIHRQAAWDYLAW